jgi:diguanylate cyclase (GGDEF)-like protein
MAAAELIRWRSWTGRVRSAELWALPRPLRAYVITVCLANVIALSLAAATLHVHRHDVLLFGLLLGCVAATVELTRRSSDPTGVVKDVYAVWELPAVILLPTFYAIVTPIIRLALTQWRVRRAPVYRRAFTAAAIGLSYGTASLVFRSVTAGTFGNGYRLTDRAGAWLLAATACAVVQWTVNQTLVLTAIKSADPTARVIDMVFSKEPLHNDITELCAAILVALGVAVSSLTLIVALPLVTLLQRSFAHAKLLSESRADSKTGLLNAATWERDAAAEIGRAARTGSPAAVLLLDLDRFKSINDTYGHLIGDQVLKEVARALTDLLRDYDLAGRFGGEEFAVLLPQTRAVDAFRIAERLRARVANLLITASDALGRVPVTVSIGVAALDAGSKRELPDLLAAADAALYRAKSAGRDQVQMISTTRGLSAVRPPADEDGDAQLDGTSSTASIFEPPLVHSEASPLRRTSGVG